MDVKDHQPCCYAHTDYWRERAERAEAAIAATVGMTDRETLQWWGRYANDETMKLRKTEAAVRRLREALAWCRRWMRRSEWAAQAQMAAIHGYVPSLALGEEGELGFKMVDEALAATEPTP